MELGGSKERLIEDQRAMVRERIITITDDCYNKIDELLKDLDKERKRLERMLRNNS